MLCPSDHLLAHFAAGTGLHRLNVCQAWTQSVQLKHVSFFFINLYKFNQNFSDELKRENPHVQMQHLNERVSFYDQSGTECWIAEYRVNA